MKKLLFVAALSMLVLQACNKDIIKESNTGKSIEFRSGVGTKGVQVTTSTLNSFNVTSLTESGAAYFNDETFTRQDGDVFTSVTSYYWPASEALHFYAYSPADIKGDNLSISKDKKQLTSYAPDANITDQIDIVIAKASGNKENNEQNGVYLNFLHQLSQIEIKAKNENEGFVYVVNGIKIMNVSSAGDLDFSVTTTWNTANYEKTNYSVDLSNNPVTLTTSAKSLMPAENNNAMLIPQTTTAWDFENETTNASKGSYIAVQISIVTKDGSKVFPAGDADYGWIAYPYGFVWEPGYKYIYTLNFTDGAGYVDPENTPGDDDDPTTPDNPYNPGDKVLGGKMTFDAVVDRWDNYWIYSDNNNWNNSGI